MDRQLFCGWQWFEGLTLEFQGLMVTTFLNELLQCKLREMQLIIGFFYKEHDFVFCCLVLRIKRISMI